MEDLYVESDNHLRGESMCEAGLSNVALSTVGMRHFEMESSTCMIVIDPF